MKKTIYGNTEITTWSACHECTHCLENDEGLFYCEFCPEEPFEDDEDDSLPSIVLSIYHGTYGNVTSVGCDCEEFEKPYDGE